MQLDLDGVVSIISRVGGVAAIDADKDFYEAGVSSVAALSLLFELEEAGGVSIPDDRFVEARTPRQLYQMMNDLQRKAA